MASRIKTMLSIFMNPQKLRILLSLEYFGYLKDKNWMSSVLSKESVGEDNKPLPWFTYPFIDFLKVRLNSELNVLEFGSGNSTIWFSDKIKTITSIEHNKEWHSKVSAKLKNNCKLILNESNTNDYHKIAESLNTKFDIIIVDAIDRVNCLKTASSKLGDKGVVILDNSNRKEYKSGIDFLLAEGFKKIDFYGMTPIITSESCTTVFYKENNCLNI